MPWKPRSRDYLPLRRRASVRSTLPKLSRQRPYGHLRHLHRLGPCDALGALPPEGHGIKGVCVKGIIASSHAWAVGSSDTCVV